MHRQAHTLCCVGCLMGSQASHILVVDSRVCFVPMCACAADFVRLIQDPAATHIELKGDIVFTHDYFPPENAHDKSKGINITHKVCLQPQLPPAAR